MDPIYRELINRISEDIVAEKIAVGETWIAIKASCGAGVASLYDAGHEIGFYEEYEGISRVNWRILLRVRFWWNRE